MKKPREFCVVEHKQDHHLSLEHYRCWLRPEGSHEADVTIITIEKSAYTDLQARAEKLVEAFELQVNEDTDADIVFDIAFQALKEWREGE